MPSEQNASEDNPRSSAALGPAELEDLAGLERRVVEHDGGRLKLEWRSLRSRDGARPTDITWSEDGRLLGFAGLYQFGGSRIEMVGMVDPGARRRGIGAALLARALAHAADRADGHDDGYVLLVCPRTATGGGAAFATAAGGTPDHSEHALLLSGEPADGPSDPATTLRPATPTDAGIGRALLLDGFGFDDAELEKRFAERDGNIIVERDGEVVGYLGVTLDGEQGGVYGFVIQAALRGRGIGRDVLRRTCRDLRARGATRVGLEVEVENEHALGLYTSLGFEPVITEDYFRMPVPTAR